MAPLVYGNGSLEAEIMAGMVERPGLWPGSFRDYEFNLDGLEAGRCWLGPIAMRARL